MSEAGNLDQRLADIVARLSELKSEELYAKVEALIEEADLDSVVGSKPDGSPFTLLELQRDVQKSEDDILKGRTHSTHELRAYFKARKRKGEQV